MPRPTFDAAVAEAVKRDPRYAPDAYAFLRDGLDFTIAALKKGRGGEVHHVSGPELCQGLREYALQQFGPMVPTILEAWGVSTTRDIGEMVFNLIEVKAFNKSASDRIEDFDDIFPFDDAFVKPFLPTRDTSPRPPQQRL